ncbi:hypothetical protein PYW08_013324 [Mythimna loreyi]|uniref:Uncharacterized protein n=1 Tax=Mythimna loreyi TaxID=667449 RepID=A0ACC2QKA0_9NEOP|nr:hypothetical protein PYW08_013324 [Mythimna loreyi]
MKGNKVPHNAPPTEKDKEERRKRVVQSTIYTNTDVEPQNLEGVEETEITAQISLPTEGGWGWVVVAASFMTIFLLDGVFFTFGSIYHEISDDLGVDTSLVALFNSVAVAVYFMAGPFASALINRFGFRAICMSGSIISSLSLLCTHFATSFVAILLLYGVLGGLGACLSSMASGLIVGFYFEKLRSLAMSISSIGSSVGIMIMFSVNSKIVKLAGWRVIMLFHSGLLGIIYFFSMAFRPLLSLTVTTTVATDPEKVADPTRTVTYLPSLAAIKATPSGTKKEGVTPSAAERLFSAVSNVHFPTAAAVVGDPGVPTPIRATQATQATQAGPSTAAVSKLTITAQGPSGGVSQKQLKQVQSIISKSRTSMPQKEERIEKQIEIDIKVETEPKKKWWQKLFQWEEHVSQARPMYRDDAFYEGRVDKLPVYQKSMVETAPEARTGLEYQMAVSRAVTAAELTEKRGVCTTAVRRILATMLDPKLLKRISFQLLCTSGFFTYLGYLVPYVFLPDRNKSEGIPPEHCSLFVSVIGLANAFGRLAIGTLAMKLNPVNLYLVVCLISGIAIMSFNFSFNLYYQYSICVLFGFHIASLSCVRSVVIVYLYGLEMLTNATGMMIMFQGLGSLISTPISSIIEKKFGYTISFYVAGAFVIISGVVLVPVRALCEMEKRKINVGPKPPATINKENIFPKEPPAPTVELPTVRSPSSPRQQPVPRPPRPQRPPPVTLRELTTTQQTETPQ